MASKAEFKQAVDDYDAEADRLKKIILDLAERQVALSLQDPQLKTKLDALKAEYAEVRPQVNAEDAKIKLLDKEMCRQANDLKEVQETDDGKIAISKVVLASQQSFKTAIPIAVQFKDDQKLKYKWVEDHPEQFNGGTSASAASTSATAEASRVTAESSKLVYKADQLNQALPASAVAAASRITNPNETGTSYTEIAAAAGRSAVSNVAKGVASVVTGLQNPGSVVDVLQKVIKGTDGGADVKSFALSKVASGGPPYENILEQFASYAPIWTMAALTPTQFNNPGSYRGKPSALKNVVFSSGGRFDSQRTQTIVGAPEYFVNNFEFITTAGASPAVGNSNIQTVSFDVYEPYSMGFLLQSLSAAAIDSGYTSYNDCPFVLKLEFVGYKQDGSVYESSELLTKYFTVRLNDVNFSVTEAGSQYKVKCTPYNLTGFSNIVCNIPNDVTLKIDGNPGEDTSKILYILSKGENSLTAALNKIQENLVKEGQQSLADRYEIVFPVNWTDYVGMSPSEAEDAGLASFVVDAIEKISAIKETPYLSSDEFGDGEIGQSQLGFQATTGGNFNFGLAGDAVDPNTGAIKRDALTIDPKQRTFTFAQGTPIQQIIAQTILTSEYGKDAADEKNLDDRGMIKWFRIDVQVLLGAFDTVRGTRQRKYLFRVMPYYVHSADNANSSAAPPGLVELKKVVAKEYDYYYTGQNNSVLKFDIQINNLFHQMKLMTPPSQNDSVSNQDTNRSSEENPETATAEKGNNPAQQGTIGAVPTKGTPEASKAPAKGGMGAKDVGELVATAMYNAIKSKGGTNGDLVRINIEIIGDPYFLVDQGMSNYLGEAAIDPNGQVPPEKNQITADQTMNYQGTDCFINIVFRTPIEPNLGVTGQGGLYSWPNGGAENPYSGLYKIVKITNRFSDGLFRQTIEANRMPGQPGDFPDTYTPTWKNTFVYSNVKETPTKGSVVDSSANSSLDLRSPEEIQASADLGNFEG